MKKSVFIVVCMLASVLLTGCIYNRSTEGGCTCVSKTIKLPVASADWQFDQDARRFYCHFNRSEINSDVYKNGQWTISREYNSGYNNAYQVALPESVFKSENTPEGTVYYTQHIDYAVGIGWVEITLTNSDYIYEENTQHYLINPEGMIFIMQIQY